MYWAGQHTLVIIAKVGCKQKALFTKQTCSFRKPTINGGHGPAKFDPQAPVMARAPPAADVATTVEISHAEEAATLDAEIAGLQMDE